jgi:hypothetical protein
VCAGPAELAWCARCDSHAQAFGGRLADEVFTLSYAQDRHPDGRHQSVQTAYAYKWDPPDDVSRENLAAVVRAATFLHGGCLAGAAGSWWETVTFVPSTRRKLPPAAHPTAGLAQAVATNSGLAHRVPLVPLVPGPRAGDPERMVLPDRFVLPAPFRDRVAGRHVLVVDDTWTTGSKAQSAAVTLRDAGAAVVTVLCALRWCRWDWPGHAELLRTLDEPYDAFRCPVTGDTCPEPNPAVE